MTPTSGHLFDGEELFGWLRQRKTQCEQQLAAIPVEQIVERPLQDLADELTARYRVTPVTLRRADQYRGTVREARVWASGVATARVHSGKGELGYTVSVHVPFDGEAELLFLKTVGGGLTPQGRLDGNELVYPFEWHAGEDPMIQLALDGVLDRIEDPYLKTQRSEIEKFNTELEARAIAALTARRDGFLEATQYLDQLRIPVFESPSAPRTYAAPGVERRPAPTLNRGAPAEAMEPALVGEFYRHIVGVIAAMARGMERNPGDYAQWTEEQLRDALLVILNTHYEGAATGETFNRAGKTDILVRVGDRSVFVGECKWWSGQQDFAGDGGADKSALDQLLSYATWRDSKLALAVFVKQQDIGAVITAARRALEQHPPFIAWKSSDDDAQLRARVKLGAEQDREADVAVVFIHLSVAPAATGNRRSAGAAAARAAAATDATVAADGQA